MCDYKEECAGAKFRARINNDSICFGTPTGCEFHPVMKELTNLREDIKNNQKTIEMYVKVTKKQNEILEKIRKFNGEIDSEINNIPYDR